MFKANQGAWDICDFTCSLTLSISVAYFIQIFNVLSLKYTDNMLHYADNRMCLPDEAVHLAEAVVC